MSKNIAEFLHYYIGQKCLINNEVLENKIDTITHINSNGDIAGNEYEWLAKDGQPILRKLEDMTEEEMRGLYRVKGIWAYIPEAHIKTIGFDKSNKNCITYSYDGPEGGTGWRCGSESMYLNQLWPIQFHYLISKGFDLFNLIDAGLAIDAKTITQ